MDVATGGGCPLVRSPMIAPGNCPASRPWPFFDPRREQADDLSNAGRAQIRPAGGCINPAQISLAVNLRERIEECARRRVSRERRSDIVGEIAALRTFRGQLDGHLIADRDSNADQALRGQGQHPSAVRRHEPGADPAAADRAADGMISLRAPRLIWIERHRDDRGVPGRGATTARKRCEPMTPSWHDSTIARGQPERADLGADRQSSRQMSASLCPGSPWRHADLSLIGTVQRWISSSNRCM